MPTYHLAVKFPIEYGIEEAQGDQLTARECYLAMLEIVEQLSTMNIKERSATFESIKELEDIPLNESNLEKITSIGSSLDEKTKQDLVIDWAFTKSYSSESHLSLIWKPRTAIHIMNKYEDRG